LALLIITIVFGIALPVIRNVPWESATAYMIVFLLLEGLDYYVRVKSSMSANRAMYIFFGTGIGAVLWIMLPAFLHFSGLLAQLQGANEVPAIIVNIAACFSLDAVIGDMIGRLRHCKGLEQYQP
jgi:hypothetical protein